MSILKKHNLLLEIATTNQDILHDPGVTTRYLRKTTGQIVSGLMNLAEGYTLINEIGGGNINDNGGDNVMDVSEINFHIVTPASISEPDDHVEKMDACQAIALQCVRKIFEMVNPSGDYQLIQFNLNSVSYDEMPIEVYNNAVGCMIRATGIFYNDNLNYNPAKWP